MFLYRFNVLDLLNYGSGVIQELKNVFAVFLRE